LFKSKGKTNILVFKIYFIIFSGIQLIEEELIRIEFGDLA